MVRLGLAAAVLASSLAGQAPYHVINDHLTASANPPYCAAAFHYAQGEIILPRECVNKEEAKSFVFSGRYRGMVVARLEKELRDLALFTQVPFYGPIDLHQYLPQVSLFEGELRPNDSIMYYPQLSGRMDAETFLEYCGSAVKKDPFGQTYILGKVIPSSSPRQDKALIAELCASEALIGSPVFFRTTTLNLASVITELFADEKRPGLDRGLERGKPAGYWNNLSNGKFGRMVVLANPQTVREILKE